MNVAGLLNMKVAKLKLKNQKLEKRMKDMEEEINKLKKGAQEH